MATINQNRRIKEYFKKSECTLVKKMLIFNNDNKSHILTKNEERETQRFKTYIRRKANRWKIKDSDKYHLEFYLDIRKYALLIERYKKRIKPFKFPKEGLLEFVVQKRAM